jgi:1-pyrroline-5-carboxylate dehydrogenase
VDAITNVPWPMNEPPLTYGQGTPERTRLATAFAELEAEEANLRCYIGGEWREARGEPIPVVQPHDRKRVLGVTRNATVEDAAEAAAAAMSAAAGWRSLGLDDRCAVLLKAADLLAGPWRQRMNAATVLGQSKTAIQAESDSACELADFWRFNAYFAKRIVEEQPLANQPGVWNRTDHRPLEGFVYAITPFNFTAIAGNLPTAPALMGNTVVWKPSPTQQRAASLTMELLVEAGMPPGVINMVTPRRAGRQ